jgi:putative ABC transport system permease protein
LLVLREVSPLAVLRINYESPPKSRTKHAVVVMTAIGALTFLFTIWQTGKMDIASYFIAGAAVLIGVLAAFSKLLMWGIKRFFTFQWGFVPRQALANLYRPNNRTVTLMISIGTGIFLISTIYIVQFNLLNQIRVSGEGQQPNLVLFDIQPDQLTDTENILKEAGLPVLQKVPIVTMRLQALNNRPVWEIRQDSSSTIPQWTLVREYRTTYRDTLIDTETIIAGEWVSAVAANADVVPISLESGIAENLQVGIGDSLTFDVQGVPVKTVVASIRKVDWQRVQPNFFVLFPAGILEAAPQMYVLVSRASNKAASADVQRRIVEKFPTVSVIDLELVLKTAESILEQISWVIRFMAMFCILTGLVVLIATLMITRYQRIRESVLLRTIGAQTGHIYRITLIEFALLGVLATSVGAVLSLLASWGLLTGLFRADFVIPYGVTLGLCVSVLLIVVSLGLWISRGITRLSPLEVLRRES